MNKRTLSPADRLIIERALECAAEEYERIASTLTMEAATNPGTDSLRRQFKRQAAHARELVEVIDSCEELEGRGEFL